jgi:RNA polymerase sigma-70 factor (ECF subfamily)
VRDPTEKPLVDGLRRGDRAAFDAAYARFRPRVHAFLLRLSGRRDTAEDLSQETWLKLARTAPRLAEDTDLAAWLFTVARNAWISHRRWAALDLSRLVALGDEPDPPAEGPRPDDRADDARAIARLERALTKLPASSREVLLLIGVEGFEQEQAAEILGIRYDALRQRLARARTQLASAIETLRDVEVDYEPNPA